MARDLSSEAKERVEPASDLETVTFSDLMVRTKDKRLVQFVPNEVQTRYLDLLARDYPPFDWRNGIYTLRGLREDCLKARQQGMSSLWLALYFIDTINNPFTQTIIAADNSERAELLFKIIHRFYEHLPPEKQRAKKYSTRKEIVFKEIDSAIYVGTAGQGTLGRGGTVNNVLMSERGFWVKGDEIEAGLLESVPMESGNVTRETTANGLNEYYQERQREHRGESRFKPRFFGWNLSSEYRIAVPPGFQHTAEEERLASAYDLTDEQLAWRREKAKDLKGKMPQEYPICEEEAFLTSGHSYFDRSVLMALSTLMQGSEYDPLENVVLPPAEFPMLRNAIASGQFQMWRWPTYDDWYVIGADTAKGLTENAHSDFCSADVLCVRTWEQVAHLHGKWEPHLFGQLLAEMGRLYNLALIGVERENHGHAVLDALLYTAQYPPQKGNGGSGVYFHDPALLTGSRQSSIANRQSLQAGWSSNMVGKPFADDKLAEALTSDPGLWLNCRETVAELLTYVHLPGGKAGGEAGSHDDRVRSLAIGVALLNLRFERHNRRSPTLLEPVPPVIRYGRPKHR